MGLPSASSGQGLPSTSTGASSLRSCGTDQAWSLTSAHSTGLPKFFCGQDGGGVWLLGGCALVVGGMSAVEGGAMGGSTATHSGRGVGAGGAAEACGRAFHSGCCQAGGCGRCPGQAPGRAWQAGRTPPLERLLALKLSVKMRWASLNSGVEKERRGSSFFLISSSCSKGGDGSSPLGLRGMGDSDGVHAAY